MNLKLKLSSKPHLESSEMFEEAKEWETSSLYTSDKKISKNLSGSFYENVNVNDDNERYLDIAQRLATSPTTSVWSRTRDELGDS